MRLYIIRHADPDYPNKTITAAGHLEAQALAERLEREAIDRIFVSPLGRAQDTMAYTAKRLGLDYSVEEWVAEIGGMGIEDEDGKRTAAWNIHGEIIRQRPLPTAENWNTRPPFDDPSFVDIVSSIRMHSDQFLARLGFAREAGTYRVSRPNQERIAVFCHYGLGLTWLSHLLDIPLTLMWSGFFLPPSSVTVVLFDQRSDTQAVPRCLTVGDTSHLYAAGLPIQPAGIVANYE